MHVHAPDHIDIDSKDQNQMLEYIKKITYELGTFIKGSEPYVKEILFIVHSEKLKNYLRI